MKEHRYWVYIMTSSSLSAMYIGVTNDLGKRVIEHRTGVGSEFVKKYKVTKLVITKLVYAEEFELIEEAIAREKQLKGWKRIRKNELVRAANPRWDDLMHDGELGLVRKQTNPVELGFEILWDSLSGIEVLSSYGD